MDTLCTRYRLDPNRIEAFRTCVEDETPVIRRSGGRIVGYDLPTDFAGPTDIGYRSIEFETLERSPPKWMPVRRKSARQSKDLESCTIATRSGTTPTGYERYRQTLAADPAHGHNVAALRESGAVLGMDRSFVRRHSDARPA